MSMLGKHHSEKTREKMRLSRIGQLKGEKNPRWKGGQFTDGYGYIYILMPEHPRTNSYGYVKRSHLVAEKTLGRYLYPGEITHHKNGKRDDDRPENIEVMTKGKHTSFHNKNREKNRRRNTLGQYIAEVAKKDLLGEFEAPIWAHRHMRKMGLNPLSSEDWAMFKEHCE